MENIILFCKSYRNDLNRFKVLTESILKHNKDNIPFYVSIPKKDKDLFSPILNHPDHHIIFDEDVTTLMDSQSHFTQQLFKMEFARTQQIAEYLFTMDSDMYFIRDFTKTDFVTKEGLPYFTMHECKDLLELSPLIFGDNRIHEWFVKERLPIMEVFGRAGQKPYDYSGSAALYIKSVFEGLYENYCIPNKLNFLDLLNYKASENNWYGEYALYSGLKFRPCGPMFKTFHYKAQYDLHKQLGITEHDISKSYLGITMQSNWNSPLRY